MVEMTRADAVREIAAGYAAQRGPLLPVLHAVQDRFGAIERGDLVAVADVLNLSIADVHGVMTFFHDFRAAPPPTHVVAICRGEACQSVGAERLMADVRADLQEASDVEVHEVFCLGNCALGPSGTVDGRLFGHLTASRVGASLPGRSS
ncbi:MAG TPA: NAD(P)H-dependent oxidoreductase subunit E [Dermatophilaceae bacterium]|nr:NAD(P)H-dependent oxidoreductase subunit E [Dermatophilaceae bacterium]HOR14185.1 NAD(P)H-dependent oxidoreductase subunit E [Dermatophilaceae bacterium]HOU99662.1 NAD(P)H-dependent oxidoreductase subunit E [Dermatophilaceae bacterium]HPK87957.1 NAD(P)H-dependent oxidoreductase subunit E [Dermatophilaceae bacterium]HQG11537.1 NAD(P)H-dependent oxidoreductase subunit E [Dermatophilaceae bacterium]